MSYSFRLPEEDPICECKYDEARDRMDRKDWMFHYDIVDDPEPPDEVPREQPGSVEKDRPEDREGLEAGMKIQYDPEEDVLSILLSENPVEESDEDKPGLILDFDKDGNVVGLEILDASKRMGNPLLVEYSILATPR